ncbi:unnamed protein product [Amoebophrya sp. A25]|nr:unnamed protein product [Amoebophrya sp. A25]|eukprot:GSA25T00011077001.1
MPRTSLESVASDFISPLQIPKSALKGSPLESPLDENTNGQANPNAGASSKNKNRPPGTVADLKSFLANMETERQRLMDTNVSPAPDYLAKRRSTAGLETTLFDRYATVAPAARGSAGDISLASASSPPSRNDKTEQEIGQNHDRVQSSAGGQSSSVLPTADEKRPSIAGNTTSPASPEGREVRFSTTDESPPGTMRPASSFFIEQSMQPEELSRLLAFSKDGREKLRLAEMEVTMGTDALANSLRFSPEKAASDFRAASRNQKLSPNVDATQMQILPRQGVAHPTAAAGIEDTRTTNTDVDAISTATTSSAAALVSHLRGRVFVGDAREDDIDKGSNDSSDDDRPSFDVDKRLVRESRTNSRSSSKNNKNKDVGIKKNTPVTNEAQYLSSAKTRMIPPTMRVLDLQSGNTMLPGQQPPAPTRILQPSPMTASAGRNHPSTSGGDALGGTLLGASARGTPLSSSTSSLSGSTSTRAQGPNSKVVGPPGGGHVPRDPVYVSAGVMKVVDIDSHGFFSNLSGSFSEEDVNDHSGLVAGSGLGTNTKMNQNLCSSSSLTKGKMDVVVASKPRRTSTSLPDHDDVEKVVDVAVRTGGPTGKRKARPR